MAVMPVRLNLVVPLAHEATDMRSTDTAATPCGRSGAVSRLSDRPGDVHRANGRSTPATTSTPGSRTWRRTLRRRTFNEALTRVAAADPADVWTSANSYFGLLRQASHSHADRARLANLVRRRGHVIDGTLTKAHR